MMLNKYPDTGDWSLKTDHEELGFKHLLYRIGQVTLSRRLCCHVRNRSKEAANGGHSTDTLVYIVRVCTEIAAVLSY